MREREREGAGDRCASACKSLYLLVGISQASDIDRLLPNETPVKSFINIGLFAR